MSVLLGNCTRISLFLGKLGCGFGMNVGGCAEHGCTCDSPCCFDSASRGGRTRLSRDAS